jgi:hypothetical protein
MNSDNFHNYGNNVFIIPKNENLSLLMATRFHHYEIFATSRKQGDGYEVSPQNNFTPHCHTLAHAQKLPTVGHISYSDLVSCI